MNAGLRLDAVDGALDGVDAPFLDLLGIAAEGRFIELDEGRPERVKGLGLHVQGGGDGQAVGAFIAVIGVMGRIDDGQRSGKGDLYRQVRYRLGETKIVL